MERRLLSQAGLGNNGRARDGKGDFVMQLLRWLHRATAAAAAAATQSAMSRVMSRAGGRATGAAGSGGLSAASG